MTTNESSIRVRIFVADDVSEKGLAPLREAGFLIEKHIGLTPEVLRKAVVDSKATAGRGLSASDASRS